MTVCDAENEFLENFARQDDINLKFHSRFALEILLTMQITIMKFKIIK